MSKIKKVLKKILPSFLIKILSGINSVKTQKQNPNQKEILDSSEQDLDLYWNKDYAEVLETWGENSTWNEIQLLLGGCKGKVLDIACGTGITIKKLEKFSQLELYGFDISDLLIEKALSKNIAKERLKVADATKSNYKKDEFDYSFSIGSLEHFTLDGIDDFIRESSRVTLKASFHMIPVSRSNEDEGWMKTIQSFYNNSEGWWLNKFEAHFNEVYPIASKWEDNISIGRWFVCINEL